MLTDQSSKKVYNIAGVTTPIATGYEIPFTIFQASDVVVSIGNEDGTVTAITEGWSVSMAESDTGVNKVVFDSGYTFPDGSTTLTISRDVPAEQDLDLRNGDDMDAEDIEEALDKLTAQIQQLNEVTGRTFKLPISENPEELSFPSASARAGKMIGFDDTGYGIRLGENPDDAIATAEELLEEATEVQQDVTEKYQAVTADADQVAQDRQKVEQIAEDIDLDNINDKFEELDQKIDNVQSNIVLPVPEVSFAKYAMNDGGLIQLDQNWVGYDGGITVRAKVGADPSATDQAISPDTGLAVTANGKWYIRSFANEEAGGKPSPSVFITVEGLKCQTPAIFYNITGRQVTITAQTAGSIVRYTTDGSEPSESNGTEYTAPFTLTTTSTVKAKAFKAGILDSDTVSKECIVARVYGVVWNRNDDSTKLTRLTPETDPFDLVTETIATEPVAAKNASDQGSSPMDGTKLWGQMRMRNIDGTTPGAWMDEEGFTLSGKDVVVKLPDDCYFTIKNVESDGQKLRYYIVGDEYVDGLTKHPGSGKYIGRYFTNASDKSVTGGSAYSSNLGDLRTRAASKGTGWHQQGIVERCLVDLLYIVEYADWNSQKVIGNGDTSAQDNNGGTDSMVYHTGISGTTCQYRYIENLWGYYEWVDGILFQNGKIRICKDYTKFSNTITSDYEQFGFTYNSSIGDGFIKDLAYDEDEPWLFIVPSAVGGSSTTYVPDYGYLYYSSSVYALCVGNNSGGSTNRGLFRFRSFSTPSSSNYASRLVFEEPSAA